MIERKLKRKALELAEKFPILAIIGPRQAGKTTFVRSVFKNRDYYSLEEPDTRNFANSDPRAFLSGHPNGLILDEVQRTPELFSYLQYIVDNEKSSGKFILTGSQHFLLHERISQTLAGRVAILNLLPFSYNEIKDSVRDNENSLLLFKGFFPPIYDRNLNPADWYQNYIQTYVERDVRLVKNITDLNTFNKFIKMCAGRIGQLLNLSSLSNEVGISVNTVNSWLSLLEASFVIFRTYPYYKNFNKRLVKMPKIYFYDVGLASNLLGIKNENQISTHYSFGALFENFVMLEILKHFYNNGIKQDIYFWRDKLGREIDCILENTGRIKAIEIKAGKTIIPDFFRNIEYWNNLTGNIRDSYIIYGGIESQIRTEAAIIPWTKINNIL